MEAFEPKPTYEEQLAWLDMVKLIYSEDPEMIKAIKENVIAVRNYEKALDNELQPVQKEIEAAFDDLVAYGETRQPGDFIKFNNLAIVKREDVIEALNDNYPESGRPFVFRADKLNPREELAIDNRIKQLNGELQAQLSLKKPFRSQQVIDHCHKSINNLKKWKSQSL